MPTKEQLESQLSNERQKTVILAGLVQRLQRRYQSFQEDVQAHIAHVQNQLNELDDDGGGESE